MSKPARRYTVEDIDAALAVVAVYGGRTQLAADKLAEIGQPIAQSTLQNWKDHPDGRYDRVCTNIAPQIAERTAGRAENIVNLLSDLEEAATLQMLEQLPSLKPAEIPGAIRNFSTSKALNMDKVINPIRGRPSTITEHRDAGDVLESLASRLPPVIQGKATETKTPKEAEADTPAAFLSGQSSS